jgi:hypothetical protein
MKDFITFISVIALMIVGVVAFVVLFKNFVYYGSAFANWISAEIVATLTPSQ